jgi:hypothetical protein
VVTLTLAALGDGRVALDPYPLTGGPLSIDISVRRIPDHRYGSAEQAASAYHSAPPTTRRVQLGPPPD